MRILNKQDLLDDFKIGSSITYTTHFISCNNIYHDGDGGIWLGGKKLLDSQSIMIDENDVRKYKII